MTKPFAQYNPTERFCDVCGKMIITHNASEYLFKKRKNGKTLWFCGYGCQCKYESENPVKHYNRLVK